MTIEANRIGTDPAGENVLGVQRYGIRVQASGTTVGSPTSPDLGANVIGGHDSICVWVFSAIATISDVTIVGNRIGVRTDASSALPNQFGIAASDVSNLTLDGNVVSGNTLVGISVFDSDGLVVRDNLVGTNDAAIDLGNGSIGVAIDGAVGATVEATLSGPDFSQLIAFNGGSGLEINDCTGCRVEGTVFGSRFTGDIAGNQDTGITLSRTSGATVEGNWIGENFNDGVEIRTGSLSTGNRIQANHIFGNGDLGIELGPDGPTPNDPGDVDTGENRLQNHPEFDPGATYYDSASGQILIRYRLEGAPPDVAFPVGIDLYDGDPDDTQGEHWIGQVSLAAPNGGAFVTDSFTTPGEVRWHLEARACTSPSVPVWCIED